LAFQFVVNTEDGAFGDIAVRSENFFNAAGREAVVSDIDDVVGTGHDEDVAVVVHEPAVGGFVIAGESGEVGIDEAFIVVP